MESIPLRYQLSQHCDLMEVGGELDSKGYGIGVPKDSPYRDSLSNAILNLSEMQILLNLYNKWWNVSTCVLYLMCLGLMSTIHLSKNGTTTLKTFNNQERG